ncbi:hypothetical protein VHEMI09265 [[Torrubiella] hemipterigena]|uniref:LITAF domain-containing protein n=1 Tax=[Torrubiella] hemipterigena TaxID=1531966 RepID=A0A0A1TR93_9HYPO|nr:hypothetical protein VHEMI09265 [[Torrubiella] hemipterigena]
MADKQQQPEATQPQPQQQTQQQAPEAVSSHSAAQTDANNNEPPPQYYDPKSSQQPQQQTSNQQAAPGQAAPTQRHPTVPLHMLADGPQWIDCPFCHHQSQTVVTKRGTDMQTIAGVVLCCFCVCLACLPCIAGWCEDREYRCSHCKNLVAVHPDGGVMQIYTPAGPAPVAVPVQHHQVPQGGQKMQQPPMQLPMQSQQHIQQPAPTHQQAQAVQQTQEQTQGITPVAANQTAPTANEKATQ